MAQTAHRIIKNTGFLYAKMGITMFISLYTIRLILNSLGAEDFGIFSIVGGAIAMLGFLNASMASATQRFLSFSKGEGDKEKQKSIFNISIILHAAIALVVGFALLGAGYFFFNGILNIPADRVFAAKVVYGSLIVSTMFTIMTVPYDAILNAHENMKYYALVGILESLLKLSVALAVVYTASDKLIVYGILMACIPLISLTIMRVYCHRHYEECFLAPRRYWSRSLMKEMTGFAGWTFSTTATSMMGNYGSGIVLNMFFGARLNAAQSIGAQLNGQLCTFATTMLKALNPVIAKSEGAGDHHQMQNMTLAGNKFSYFLVAIFAIPALLEMPFILKIWLDTIPAYTIIFARLQLCQTMIEQLTLTLGIAIGAQGKIRNYSICRTIFNILPLPLIYLVFHLGAPPFFMLIISIVLYGFVGNILLLYYAGKNCNISFDSFINKVFKPAVWVTVPPMICGICTILLLTEGWIRLILTSLICGVVFIICSWYKGTNTDEHRQIINILRNIKNTQIKRVWIPLLYHKKQQ